MSLSNALWVYSVASIYDWKDILPFLAALVGIVTLLMTWLTHQQRATFDMIDGIYDLGGELHAHLLRDWRLTHLFCIGEVTYYSVRENITRSLERSEKRDELTCELAAKERLFAINIFMVFEQAYYHWRETSVLFRRRRRFLLEMLSFFTDRLLRNPRLVAYLNSDQVGRSLHMEPESRMFLAECLREVAADEDGPFRFRLTPLEGAAGAPSWRLRYGRPALKRLRR